MKNAATNVVELSVHDLVANPWNANRMSKAMMRKLKAYVAREGLVEPLVVRPHPSEEDKYELLGGFHRWQICRDELCYETVPCVIVEGLDDKRARVLSLNLNSMSGQPVPSLLADLLADLGKGMTLPDMEAVLPWDKSEIVDFQSLLQVPEGFADELEAEAAEQDEEAPEVLTLVLDRRQASLWEEAVELASTEVGGARNPKARTLELMTEHFLSTTKAEEQAAG
jgi:ParB-like chromosome segregation protein Spo0J